MPFLIAFKVDRDLLIGQLIALLDAYKKPTAIMSDDGLFVHPEAFGKVMVKLGKRYLRD